MTDVQPRNDAPTTTAPDDLADAFVQVLPHDLRRAREAVLEAAAVTA